MKNAVGRDIPDYLLVNGKEVYQGKNYMDGKYIQKAAPKTRRYEKPQESKIVATIADAPGPLRPARSTSTSPWWPLPPPTAWATAAASAASTTAALWATP